MTRRVVRIPSPGTGGAAAELINAAALCSCGHLRSSHLRRLPAPCDHGRTIPDLELMARSCDETLTDDPRFGCKCIGFQPAPPN